MPQPTRKLLFTPGPLNTSETVRKAMLTDIGSREIEFIQIVRNIRNKLLKLADLKTCGPYVAVPMQGSGTFAIEAVIGTLIQNDGKLLVLINGAYGHRMVDIATRLKVPVDYLVFADTEPICLNILEDYLCKNQEITQVAVVHCETTTGIVNPIAEIGSIVANAGKQFIVDAMSSFGGIAIDFEACQIDCLISSANKCLEGVPGLSFVIVKNYWLKSASGQARSLSLDLHAQWQALEKNGQFRFTPPTHVVLALDAALDALEREGGVIARNYRYKENQQTLLSGMHRMGFESVITPSLQSPIITAFYCLKNSKFKFAQFCELLANRSMYIYPGKISSVNSFRIGTIGDLRKQDVEDLLMAIESCLNIMEI